MWITPSYVIRIIIIKWNFSLIIYINVILFIEHQFIRSIIYKNYWINLIIYLYNGLFYFIVYLDKLESIIFELNESFIKITSMTYFINIKEIILIYLRPKKWC